MTSVGYLKSYEKFNFSTGLAPSSPSTSGDFDPFLDTLPVDSEPNSLPTLNFPCNPPNVRKRATKSSELTDEEYIQEQRREDEEFIKRRRNAHFTPPTLL